MPTGTFNLEISDPAMLLNEIAKRYESTARILMEYVDNALDDAEELYRENGGAYPHEIRIKIHLNTRRGIVTISDNCRGMTQETLRRIVQKIGESTKRGCTWVNGRFGFGVHAFRAAANRIKFHSKHQWGEGIVLQFHREQHQNLRLPRPAREEFPTDTGTGTVVSIGPLDHEWKSELNAETVKKEIELHFERLLARPNLAIVVQENNAEQIECEAFDHEALRGKEFGQRFEVEVAGETFPIDVALKVSDIPVPDRRPRFFLRGRRVNEVKSIRSFMNKSRHRTSVWGHEHLIGYIEVGELVSPVITRDDFDRSERRTRLYESILKLEDQLSAALEEINQQQKDQSLGRLESVLRRVLSKLAREDALRFRSEVIGPGSDEPMSDTGGAATDADTADTGTNSPKYDGDGIGANGSAEGEPGPEDGDQTSDGSEGDADCDSGRNEQDDGTAPGNQAGGLPLNPATTPTEQNAATRRKSGFDIKFMDLPPDAEGRHRRSRLLDGTIILNVGHLDFQDRLDHSRLGQARVTERLVGYLANVISIHYQDQYYEKYKNQPERLDQLFDEQVDFVCRLESALGPHIGLLQERMDQDIAGASNNGQDEHQS